MLVNFPMFARVLFPTDFSPQAEQLAACLNEMKPLGMEEVVLLNVVELGPQIGFASDTFEQMLSWKNDAEPRLADLRDRIEMNGIRCCWGLELGKPSLEIVRVAEEERVALIAMGTHGHGFVRGVLLGSVTHDVVRHAPVPVLVLKVTVMEKLGRTDCDFVCQHMFRRVLLPTDFSECAGEALALVKKLRVTGLPDVVVVHVRDTRKEDELDPQDVICERMERIRRELEFFGFTVNSLVVDGNPAKTIDRIAREQDVSLIVIGSKGRSAAEDVLLGSVSDAVICQHTRPVLVVRPAIS
jgi:nucleotide-binding universal stress UspA family protein